MLQNYYSVLFILFLFSQTVAQKITKEPIPSWVTRQNLNQKAEYPDKSNGFYYLVFNKEDNLSLQTTYTRYAYKILNSQGVQEMSEIDISFDPAYQKAVVHELTVYRDGRPLDRLEISDFKIIQREQDLERHLYNGQVSAINSLYDIREGDVIDYSFSIIGYNPVHEGKFSNRFSLQYSIPIEWYRYAVTFPQDQNINFKLCNDAPEPKTIKQSGNTTYSWEAKSIPAMLYESNAPGWYDPSPMVELSQFKNWNEVATQYSKYYKVSNSEKEWLTSEIEPLTKGLSKEEAATKLINLVQDEIRYLGFEDGLNSHKPSSPKTVYERRFGDCKDKSFLLSELLKTQGINAQPILVNSYYGSSIKDRSPSPFAFDHCIVQVQLDTNKTIFIDPTISDQGGKFPDIYYPNYEYGLTLNTRTKNLIKFSKPKKPEIDSKETFEIFEIGGAASLKVVTKYKGSAADNQRSVFASSTIENMNQSYTDFYSSLYPSIKMEGSIETVDERDTNVFIVKESYLIDSLWTTPTNNKSYIVAEFRPMSLETYLYPTASTNRTMPFYIDSEVKYKHHIKVFFPEAWTIENDQTKIENPNFKFSQSINYKNATLDIINEYEHLTDFIEPADVSTYLADHTKVQEGITYQLSYTKNGGAMLSENDSESYFLTNGIMFFSILGISILCWLLYSKIDPVVTVKPDHHQSIGGWLILFAIGITLTPIILLVQFAKNPDFYITDYSWKFLFSTNLKLAVLAIFVTIFNASFLIFSIFVIILFYKRRSSAPRMIVFMYAVVCAFQIIDNAIILQIAPEDYTVADRQNIYFDITKLTLRSAVVICYFLMADRVKNTFTKTYKKQAWDTESYPEERKIIATDSPSV